MSAYSLLDFLARLCPDACKLWYVGCIKCPWECNDLHIHGRLCRLCLMAAVFFFPSADGGEGPLRGETHLFFMRALSAAAMIFMPDARKPIKQWCLHSMSKISLFSLQFRVLHHVPSLQSLQSFGFIKMTHDNFFWTLFFFFLIVGPLKSFFPSLTLTIAHRS